jgi:hypothetical protein
MKKVFSLDPATAQSQTRLLLLAVLISQLNVVGDKSDQNAAGPAHSKELTLTKPIPLFYDSRVAAPFRPASATAEINSPSSIGLTR